MEIKNVREPKKEEKIGIIPQLVIFGISTAVVTLVVYLLDFKADLGESLYVAEKILPNKSIATHNAIIKLFENIYGRDYMLSKLEGLSVSALVGAIFNILIYIYCKFDKRVKGLL